MDQRDFLSLKLTNSVADEDVKDGGGAKDSVHLRGSGMQWPFSNKVFALPQFMPYKSLQEERVKKMAPEHLASSAYMCDPAADSLDTNNKTLNGLVQPKNFSIDRQGGMHYPIAAIPVQHVGAHWTHRALDNGMLYANNPFFKTHVTTSRSNYTPTMKQQPLGGTSNTTQDPYFANAGSMSGVADQRNVTKPPVASAQLTVFYGGSVCVYEDISPEKAQAIMYLAGKGSSMNPNMTSPKIQMQDYDSKSVGADGSHGNQSLTMSLCSLKDTSQANAQSRSGSSGTAESTVLSKTAFPSGSFPPPMNAAAVPQARKASLARFLEKRKERAMNAMPYNVYSKLPDSNTNPGPKGLT